MPDHQPPKLSYHLGVDRATLLVFADAVFSIAITLLVLEIRLPDLDPATNASLVAALVADIPAFMGYLISFMSIASWWVQLHQLYSYVKVLDRKLMWLTIGFLLCIGFTPFATYVFVRYPELFAAYVFYVAIYLVSAAVYYVCAAYAIRNRELLVPGVEKNIIQRLRRLLLVYGACVLLTVPLAYYSTYAAIGILVLWNVIVLAVNMFTTIVRPSAPEGPA